MKKLIIENRATFLLVVGGFLGFCVLLGIWNGLIDISIGVSGLLYMLLVVGMLLVVASLTFSDMSTKEGRIRLLMTPAPARDIFLSRLLVVLPGVILLGVAGYFVMGYTGLLADGVMHGDWNTDVVRGFVGLWPSDWHVAAFLSGLFMLNETAFILGSVLWPRRSFIKTLAVMVAIQMIFTLLTALLVKAIYLSGLAVTDLPDWAPYCPTAILWVISAVLIYVAYRRFKHKTLIR